MAKDGTNRGGARIGAGKKRKPLEDKILEGKADYGEEITEKLPSERIPPPKKYLTAEQKGGGKLQARQVYRETWEWIRLHGCEDFVTKQLVESYAQAVGRQIQCEEYLSQFGLIAKHPTTGEAIQSPFAKLSIDYSKQASQLWYQIFSAVRDNCTKGAVGNEQNDVMENLLRRVK